MLGWIGRWAASKGMVLMPNLFGLSRTEAINAINQAGLKVGSETTSETSNEANSNKVNSQSVTSGELVDYETPVNFNYQVFSFTPYSFTPYSFTPQAYSFTPQAYTFTPYTFTPYTFTPYTFTPTSTTYWYTACCRTSTGSSQITGTSTVDFNGAYNSMTSQCTSGTIENSTSGVYTTTPNIPSLTCCAEIDNGYQWVICNGSSVYLPTTKNTCTNVVSYTCPTTVWYCSVTYFNTQLPPEQYTSYQDDTGSYCGDQNIVCRQTPASYPPYPSRPPACSTYSFTPYTFTPTVYSFTPTVYSFTPYTFTPTPYTFTPYTFTPYTFTPVPAYTFTPLRYCVDSDTPVLVVGENNSMLLKPAREVAVGDYVWSIKWDELVEEAQDPYALLSYNSLTNLTMDQTQIVSVNVSTKASTMIINNDISKRFTAEEKILIKRDGKFMFEQVINLIPGDYIHELVDGQVKLVLVENTEVIDQVRDVYMFNASPIDTIIAGNMVVHNSKV